MHTITRMNFACIEWTECAAFPLMIIADTMIAEIRTFPCLLFPDDPLFLTQQHNANQNHS